MRYISLLAISSLLFFSCGPGGKTSVNTINPNNCFCVDSSQGTSLCPDIPHEIDKTMLPGSGVAYKSVLTTKIQPPFDLFSWQSFVALNWPALANGTADTTSSILTNSSSLRVWEYYPLADTVFKPLGGLMKLVLKPGDLKAAKQLYQSTAFADDFTISNQFFEADGSTLIDKNLNYVLYEERINSDEWQYINQHDLRTEAGQLLYVNTVGPVTLPSGTYTGQYGKSGGPVGAIEIKASWRILDPSKGDDTTRYYHQQAEITIGSQYTWSGKQLQFIATVGLVGFHIIHKTQMFEREIWSTFEQIDNVPDDLLEAHYQHQYSFYNPVCFSCPVNQRPDSVNGKLAMWNDTPPYAAAYGIVGKNEAGRDTGTFGTQVIREFPVFASTDSINKIFQAKLAGTVWANYKLIGSQWFKASTDAPGGPIPPKAPARLANTTLETYDQNFASCTTCHGFAYIAGGGTDSTSSALYKSDFSFLFRKAAHPSSNVLGQKARVPAPARKK
ncbi:MAG TPA: hypothetical protein VFJ43_12860 [Bacteroidia bacterium]|nr:hypothetical protein [Bacteroidia bacterium]